MAVTETVKIVFEADTKAITDTTKELTSLKKATEEDVAAFKKLSDETKNLNNTLSTTDDNFVSLRTQVKQAKDEVVRLSAEFGEFSAEAQAARVKAGQLADQMSDLNRQVNLLNPEAKAKAFVNFGSQVVGAFQIATGALQAFGAENEQVAKLAMRLQGALNVAQGIASLKQLKESYADIKVVLGVTTAAQVTQNAAQNAGVVSTGALTRAMNALKAAMLSNPFTAIAVALGTVIGAMILLNDETDEQIEKQKKLKELRDKEIDDLNDTADILQLQKEARDQGVNAARRELELLVARGAKGKELFQAQLNVAREELEALVEREAFLAGSFKNEEDRIKLQEDIKDKRNAIRAIEAKFEKDQQDEAVKNAKEAEAKKTKAIEDELKRQASLRAQFEQEFTTQEGQIDKETQQRIRASNLLLTAIENQSKGEINLTTDKEAQKLQLELKALQDKKDLYVQFGKDTTDIELSIAEKNNEIYQFDVKNKKKAADEKLEYDRKRLELLGQLSQESIDFIFSLNRASLDAQQNDLEQQREKGLITEEQYQEKLKQLKTKQAKADKEAQIFSAIMSTAQAIINALTVQPATLVPTAVAVASTIGALNLAKIIATPLPKFKQGTLSVPGTDTGQDTVMAMLRPGEAVIPTETNREYAPALRAIYRRDINAKELNDFVTNREQGAFAFNQVSLDALYKRDLKVSALTQAGRSEQLNVQPTKITADVDVQQLTRAMSKNKAVEVTNTAALGEAIAAQLSKRINPRQVI